jgi:2-(1,2-epoxy-1,2-dihydrophenyl)acetyl-CoA isomerase
MSKKEFKYILTNKGQGVYRIILNRPDRLNALNYPMIMEIIEVFEKLMKDKTVRVILIEGKEKNFCAGDDLKSMGEHGLQFKPLEDGSRLPHQKLIKLIREIQKPVIALLQGYCFGAGFELALACDFRLAADNLEMGDHRIRRAICMLSGASWFLPRLVGLAKATEIILTGKHLDSKEALEIGLITKSFPSSNFKEHAQKFIDKIANLPTKCLGYNKAMLNFSQTHDLFPSLQNEFDLYCKNFATRDYREGVQSFLEKREPKFKGR